MTCNETTTKNIGVCSRTSRASSPVENVTLLRTRGPIPRLHASLIPMTPDNLRQSPVAGGDRTKALYSRAELIAIIDGALDLVSEDEDFFDFAF